MLSGLTRSLAFLHGLNLQNEVDREILADFGRDFLNLLGFYTNRGKLFDTSFSPAHFEAGACESFPRWPVSVLLGLPFWQRLFRHALA